MSSPMHPPTDCLPAPLRPMWLAAPASQMLAFGSAFSFLGHNPSYRTFASSQEADLMASRNDWENVGADFRESLSNPTIVSL